MRVAIFGRPGKSDTLMTVLRLIGLMEEKRFHWYISDKMAEYVARAGKGLPKDNVYIPEVSLPEDLDCMITIGGDGTILEAISFAAPLGIPVAGIHTGRLGFLTTVTAGQVDLLVDVLAAEAMRYERRSLLHLEDKNKVFDGRNFALNEFAIMKRDSSSMITVHTYYDGQYLNGYWADGLIISTPTGSTGYSLSCGGPILHPTCNNFIITPVSPHNLNVRPLVVTDLARLSFEVEARSRKVLVSLDNRSKAVETSTRFSVSKESFEAILLRLPQDDFMDTLRGKLYWGADLRN